ncbi:MLX-interacting protein [Cylas formicarius]|uniref:MLX-interacting protein n=1 Tax=Cylas formicarius TaxID=197179 RepID=UPI0029584151|nr:MLX-interacting protein [Cylas formicarius]
MFTIQYMDKSEKPQRERESIHSGHFMVSHFEAEEQDDEDNVAVPIPEAIESKTIVPVKTLTHGILEFSETTKTQQQLAIDTSLSKLFQCMSLAYRQKLTSPKWNRFRGIRLRWKDKIRLNNVIWRCWHLQFIKKENTLICQFASPLDVDTHNKPEAIVLEGKYWKRKLAAVTAEYKKWRMFYRNNLLGNTPRTSSERLNDIDHLLWESNSTDHMNMMVDEDYMDLMSDTLFSTITNQPFVFPDSREIARAGLADFIQPSLGPLQPNLDDCMDTFDPLQELINSKLPTVPEEQSSHSSVGWGYIEGMSVTSSLQISDVNPYSQLQMISPPPYDGLVAPPHSDQYGGAQGRGSSELRPHSKHDRQTAFVKAEPYPSYATQTASKERTDIVTAPSQPRPQGYKFAEPARPNVKFTQQQTAAVPTPHYSRPSSVASFSHESAKPSDQRGRGSHRGRGRSRSNTREPIKRPPLLSAVSDPSLLTSASTNALLTQLLTSGSTLNSALYGQNQGGAASGGSSLEVSGQLRIKEEANPVTLMTQPSSGTLISLPSQITITTMPMQPNTDPLILTTYSNSSSPVLDTSPQVLHSPTSSQGSIGSPSRDGRDRRVGHIHAEQKRRYNIKNGFDMINSLIPHLNQNPNAKLSKAAMLQKGAEYIRQLRAERTQLKEEMDSLRQQIDALNASISNCQSLLPATGAPVSRRRDSKMQEMFDEYVSRRTMENWKFWIFSLIFRPLLNPFNNFVSTTNLDELYSSTMHWIEQHCTLVNLRPVVLNSLRYLCTKTDILSEPEKLPEEARRLVLNDKSK